jgi:hypothetical protein
MSDIIATDKTNALGMNRRMALKAFAAIAAAAQSAPLRAETPGSLTLARTVSGPTGTATDPDLHAGIVPWSRTLTPTQLTLLEQLCAIILPADEHSPSAADMGCHDFIDEWVSAPYPSQQRDRRLIVDGLEWLNQQAQEQFTAIDFVALTTEQRHSILDSICAPASAKDPQAAKFFSVLRSLVCGAFFTTDTGMKDLQYIGNQPQTSWSLPPKDVLKHLGLESEGR